MCWRVPHSKGKHGGLLSPISPRDYQVFVEDDTDLASSVPYLLKTKSCSKEPNFPLLLRILSSFVKSKKQKQKMPLTYS